MPGNGLSNSTCDSSQSAGFPSWFHDSKRNLCIVNLNNTALGNLTSCCQSELESINNCTRLCTPANLDSAFWANCVSTRADADTPTLTSCNFKDSDGKKSNAVLEKAPVSLRILLTAALVTTVMAM